VLAGRSAQLLVPPDLPHTYHYIPDVAAGLATLGTASDMLGRQWMLPCAPAVTTRELIVLIGRALGRDVAVSVMPRPVVSVARLFVPILRELDEMRYQWAVPFVVDDGQFQARFAQPATPLETAARETVDWARKTFST
jgi:nucleoside-diphosphate-sugar epimerase